MADEDDESSSEKIGRVLAEWEKAGLEHYLHHGGLPLVEFARSVRLPKPPPKWHDLAYTVTFDGTLAIMRTDWDVRAAWAAVRRRQGSRDDLVLPESARAAVSTFDGKRESAPVALPLRFPFPAFDRLADGSWIVADNRAEAGVPNAMRVDADGRMQTLMLGTGIEFLQADPDGGFWVGYGDTGIFSHDAHGMEGGGVVRFDADGHPTWLMNDDHEKPCLWWIDHVYAMNIAAGGRWFYTYSDFMLTRLDAPGGRRVLRPMVDFADAVAVSGDRIMMAGMYRPRGKERGFDRLVLLGPPGRWTPRRPAWQCIATFHRAINPAEHLLVARGDTLHCVRGRTWHRLSIAEADAQVPAGPWRSVPEVSG